jgi:hypothetical protein
MRAKLLQTLEQLKAQKYAAEGGIQVVEHLLSEIKDDGQVEMTPEQLTEAIEAANNL